MTSRDVASRSVRIVLITGEPGSGKSTLGTELARALRVPFLARDDVRGGLFLSAGSWTDTPEGVPPADQTVETFLEMVETMARLGVSCVVEYVIRRERASDLERFTALADCVVLFTSSSAAEERAVQRNLQDRLLNRRAVLDALGYLTIEDHTSHAVSRMKQVRLDMKAEFDLPTMHITTDNGYEPDLETIIEFVTASVPNPK